MSQKRNIEIGKSSQVEISQVKIQLSFTAKTKE